MSKRMPLTMIQIDALIALYENEPATVGLMRVATAISEVYIAEALRQLITIDLATRVADTKRRRSGRPSFIYSLTDRGRYVARNLSAAKDAMNFKGASSP